VPGLVANECAVVTVAFESSTLRDTMEGEAAEVQLPARTRVGASALGSVTSIFLECSFTTARAACQMRNRAL
jgi:hypothetical protein